VGATRLYGVGQPATPKPSAQAGRAFVSNPNFLLFTSYFVLSKIRATAEFFDRKLAASGERQ